jgi:hypothetical protein
MKTLPIACGLALCVLLLMGSLVRGQDDEGPTSIGFDDIKLDLKLGQAFDQSLLTEKVRGYDGKTISIRGFMSPSFQADGITEFVLMGIPPIKFGVETADKYIRVRLKKGTSTSYTIRPVTVVGSFKIKQFKVGKKTWAIYELQAGQMKTLPIACGLALCLSLSNASPARAEDDGPADISFDDIKLDLETGEKFRKDLLTKKAKDLDGKAIVIRGFMAPSFKADGLTNFVLMRNGECKFGVDAAHHFVRVTMEEGKSTSYTTRPFTIVGSFKIKQFKVGKKTWAIYELNDVSIKK